MTIQTQDLPKSILKRILELFDRGDFEAALIGVEKALLKFPHSIVLLNIQGMTLGKLNQHEAAVQVFQQIVKTNPEYAEVFINMGNAFYDKEDLDSCLDCYAKALNIKPDQSEWALYVIEALTGHTPKKKILHPIILGNDAIKKTFCKFKQSKPIADRDVIEVFFKCEKIVKDYKIEMIYPRTQIYRRNTKDLNCKRHQKIFFQHNIVPEFCFSCYKVQIEPKTVMSLIKLSFIFDHLKLPNNNIRKCLVELRTNVAGFYKGLIYCSKLQEAYQVADYLDNVIKRSIGFGMRIRVKRGCSEYSLSFPNYGEVNDTDHQLMTYNRDWKVVEDEYDRLHPIRLNTQIKTLQGLSLNDFLIMQNWISYAKGIGDLTSDSFLIGEFCFQNLSLLKKAKARLKLSLLS